MRRLRLPAVIGLALCLALLAGRRSVQPSPPAQPAAGARVSLLPNENATAASTNATDYRAAARRELLDRLAYAQAWSGPLPEAFAPFRAWTERYRTAPPAERATLEAEGVALARARRAAMRALIIQDPERALAITVPATVRRELPAAVLAELEQRIAGRGDYSLGLATYDGPPTGPVQQRTAFVSGVSYRAHPYGRREGQATKEGTRLHGIALDRELALHASPLRVLEPGEIPGAAAAEACVISDEPIDARAESEAVNVDALTVIETGGRVMELCGGAGMLETFEAALLDAEDRGARVRTALLGDAPLPPRAVTADGTRSLLVLRVNFSDLTAEPITETAMATLLTSVNSYFDVVSHGLARFAPTISARVYRMPRTGSSYASTDARDALTTDAIAAAAADYTAASYDHVMVVFPRVSPTTSPGSQWSWGGFANVVGTRTWINGNFTLNPVAHELGHNLGLKHADLWQVSDGNPVSASGRAIEYGDPFDLMGNNNPSDNRHALSPWAQRQLGYLSENNVTTVTASGTYRIYRFDAKTPGGDAVALRIFRDGVRWFWVGYRGGFTNNAFAMNGAYVTWGFNNLQQTQLLDLNTPGTFSTDSALPIGTTFTDPVSGVSIRPLARGGTEPAQWLDVQVTLPGNAASTVSAWGRNFAYFIANDAGDVASPMPETNVPMTLNNVRAISAGEQHAIALKNDGTVVAWGNNFNGQTSVPAGLSGVVGVAAGGNVSGAVRGDGSVVLWGDTSFGQTTPPNGLSGVTQLAIGGTHVLALKSDGSVVAWGSNGSSALNVPATLGTNATAIAAGRLNSIALRRDGTVVQWGTSTTAVPAGLGGVVAISTCGTASGGGTHALALKSDGQVNIPSGLNNVIAISAGGFNSLALKSDGSVVGWGYNGNLQNNTPALLPAATAIASSQRASFAITGAPAIRTQPVAQSVAAGGTATLSVAASGGSSYQWYRNGTAINGANGATLTLANAQLADDGNYSVVVSNAAGIVTSSVVLLTVTGGNSNPTPGAQVVRISNLSILTGIESATDSFTMGYVVGGAGTTGAKPLLIRAAGPSLSAIGVPNPLPDPALEIFAGADRVGENDNWGGASAVASAMGALGAFPFSSANSRDAAVVATVTTRANSVKVSGVGGATGTVIAEIYDATPAASFTSAVPRLLNVSVLKNIGSGVIVGFVIAGPELEGKDILIRAVGPGLANLGVAGFVVDPQVTLYRGNTIIGSNLDWGGTTLLNTAFLAVGAFALPAASRDAALLVRLGPGAYSVVVTPAAGTATGLAVVEVYEMP